MTITIKRIYIDVINIAQFKIEVYVLCVIFYKKKESGLL